MRQRKKGRGKQGDEDHSAPVNHVRGLLGCDCSQRTERKGTEKGEKWKRKEKVAGESTAAQQEAETGGRGTPFALHSHPY